MTSWMGVFDRLCGCSYADAQLFSERQADSFSRRSTTVPTSWTVDDDDDDDAQTMETFRLNAVPGSPSSRDTTIKHQNIMAVHHGPPRSPSSASRVTATTVATGIYSANSFDTTHAIPHTRTSSSLTTLQSRRFQRQGDFDNQEDAAKSFRMVSAPPPPRRDWGDRPKLPMDLPPRHQSRALLRAQADSTTEGFKC